MRTVIVGSGAGSAAALINAIRRTDEGTEGIIVVDLTDTTDTTAPTGHYGMDGFYARMLPYMGISELIEKPHTDFTQSPIESLGERHQKYKSKNNRYMRHRKLAERGNMTKQQKIARYRRNRVKKLSRRKNRA